MKDNANTHCADCGADLAQFAPKPGIGGASGYAVVTDTGNRICYACSAKRERADMVATGRATLYLAGRNGEQARAVTDWPGKLRFFAVQVEVKRHGGGFGCQRTDAWFNGPDGHVWHAVNRGDMDIARCRRTKRVWSKDPVAADYGLRA